jgi:hypothetical protein
MSNSVARDMTTPPASRSRPSPKGRLSPLSRDILIILAVKFVLLAGLWWAFFSHPVARDMSVDPQRVDARLFGPSRASSAGEPSRADR